MKKQLELLLRYTWELFSKWSYAVSLISALVIIVTILPASVWERVFSQPFQVPSWLWATVLYLTIYFGGFFLWRETVTKDFDDQIQIFVRDSQCYIREWFSPHSLQLNPTKAYLLFVASLEVYNPANRGGPVKFVNCELQGDWTITTKVPIEEVPIKITSPLKSDEGIVTLVPVDTKPISIRTEIPLEISDLEPEEAFSRIGRLSELSLVLGVSRAGKIIKEETIECNVKKMHEEVTNALISQAQNNGAHAPDYISMLNHYWQPATQHQA